MTTETATIETQAVELDMLAWCECGGQTCRIIGWWDGLIAAETLNGGTDVLPARYFWANDDQQTSLSIPENQPAALMPGRFPDLQSLLSGD